MWNILENNPGEVACERLWLGQQVEKGVPGKGLGRLPSCLILKLDLQHLFEVPQLDGAAAPNPRPAEPNDRLPELQGSG